MTAHGMPPRQVRTTRGLTSRSALFALLIQVIVPIAYGVDTVSDRRMDVNQILGTTESTLLELSTVATGDRSYQAQFELNGQSVTLVMAPHSVRAPGFQVFLAGADGKLTEIDPGPVRTMRGRLLEIPGSVVTGSLLSTGLDARIRLSSGEAYGLTSLARLVDDAEPQLHALYDLAAVQEAGVCGTADGVAEAPAPARLRGGFCEPVGPFNVRLGCDADSAFVATFPGTPPEEREAAQQFIEDNVLEINVNLYELPPLLTTHQIARLVLRDASNDIYASLPDNQVLGAVRTEWRTTQADANVAAATLWTGRGLLGNVVGLAATGSMCRPGYCWVEKRFGNQRLFLLAHELGHVWGAPHCTDAPCNGCTAPCAVMNPFLLSCNTSFSQCTIDEILSDRQGYACIDDPAFVDPTVLDEGVVVQDGDINLLPTVLTGESTGKLFNIRNNMDCAIPLDVRLTGARYQLVDAPTELPPNGVGTFQVNFNGADFANTYDASLQITTEGLLSGYDFNVTLRTTVGVGANLPTAPQLICPLPWATTPQPGEVTFRWSPADFVETFEFQILSSTDQVLFRQPDLQQTAFRPIDLVLQAPNDYIWVVWAHNVNGRARAASGFIVDPLNAHPILESYYRNIGFPNNHTLNLPLNPTEFTYQFEFHNEGATSLRFTNIMIPADFQARWSGIFGIGDGGSPQEIKINPCSVARLDLRSTLTPAQLAQTNIIMDTLEFDTTDPEVPHFTLNLCFRCTPVACVGDPFSGCGTVTGVTQGGCWRFVADCGTEFGIRNNGTFGINDRIWVEGAVDIDAEFCFPHVLPQIPDAQTGTCFEDCGELLEPLPCLVGPCYLRFRSATTGAVYDIENTGLFPVGSQVRVVGGLQSYTGAAFSGNPQGLIFGNTIENCPRSSDRLIRRR